MLHSAILQLAVALNGSPAPQLQAQTPDTIAAIKQLRERTLREPRNGRAFLELGALLSAHAGEREKNFPERMEAERALERAHLLLGEDPEVLLEQGLLLRRQLLRMPAKRTLLRAAKIADTKAASLPAAERYRLHLALAQIYESWWEDWQDLVDFRENTRSVPVCRNSVERQALLTQPPGQSVGNERVEPLAGEPGAMTAAASLSILGVLCPLEFWRYVDQAHPLADHLSDERASMVAHYQRALAAAPGDMTAGTRLLGHIADEGNWTEYDRIARQLLAATRDSARAWLWAGIGWHRQGKLAEAEAAFGRALPLLPPDQRARFEDIERLLPKGSRAKYRAEDENGRADAARILFTGKAPLFLDGTSERRLEHYMRVAWAELKFSDSVTGKHGWDSHPGDLLIRYGLPEKKVQCCYGDFIRRQYWAYAPAGPVFVLLRTTTYRNARASETTLLLANALAATAPELYRPRLLSTVHDIPLQVARFRGATPGSTRVDIYGLAPLTALGVAPGSPVEAGLFLFDSRYHPLSQQHGIAPIGAGVPGLFYTFEAQPGDYLYGIEARAPRRPGDTSQSPAARVRQPLQVTGFPAGALAVSDILLAEHIEAAAAAPRNRSELHLSPRFSTEVKLGEALHIYYEVYGLQADAQSMAAYQVELQVLDQTRRSLLTRIFRGNQQQPRSQWQRETPVTGDAAVDFVKVELPSIEPGEYSVSVTVTNAAGQSATSTRTFTMVR